MSRCDVQIWWVADASLPQRATHFDLVEMNVPDFEQACILIDGDRLIRAEVLRTRKTDVKDERIVCGRYPVAFRGCAVSRVQLPIFALIEEGDR